MALIMLPCDLPWWGGVKKHLTNLLSTKNTLELVEKMQKVHEICNVSLDPDEEVSDPELFIGLLNFLDNELNTEERCNFFNKTLPIMINRALNLKKWKPKGGLHFSLQQQPDLTELDYNFVSSLIANAFFSTFPNRSEKTHPTLQNFNFTYFFRNLNLNSQKSKLQSIFHYFDWVEENGNSEGSIKVFRQVMSSKDWLTIEDWLECTLPLCPFQIKHEGRLERCDKSSLQICFCSSRIGKEVLLNGSNQECTTFMTMPELLPILLTSETLEDNETVMVERVRNVTKINDPKTKATLEKLDNASQTTVSFMDADDYLLLPIGQYEEDNVLRELNKCLLAFQQKEFKSESQTQSSNQSQIQRARRLSPIGESVGSSDNSESKNIPIITQQSCSTRSNSIISTKSIDYSNMSRLLVFENDRSFEKRKQMSREGVFNNRKGRFIVLGSSGECLPIKRKESSSVYSSFSSSDDEFHSANASFDEEDEDFDAQQYNEDLDTLERRKGFAQRLREALRRNASAITTSTESSYAVDISIAGSKIQDNEIKVRRGGSTGFALKEESLDDDFLNESFDKEKHYWINKFNNKKTSALSKKESYKSSEYSFSTDVSSELEEVYEQFSRWLDNPILETDTGTKRTLNGRELAVVQFAGSLLKRTLSETFAGVPLEEGDNTTFNKSALTENKAVLNVRSLSLELARQKHKLAAQLKKMSSLIKNEELFSRIIPTENKPKNKRMARDIFYVTEIVQTLKDVTVSLILRPKNELYQICNSPTPGLKPVATGNWGCGSTKAGDVQLKVIIQWLAASVAGVPFLTYYTVGHKKLTKLDTVCRILIDRKWTVKDLVEATLEYASHVLSGRSITGTLFEDLIGTDKN